MIQLLIIILILQSNIRFLKMIISQIKRNYLKSLIYGTKSKTKIYKWSNGIRKRKKFIRIEKSLKQGIEAREIIREEDLDKWPDEIFVLNHIEEEEFKLVLPVEGKNSSNRSTLKKITTEE